MRKALFSLEFLLFTFWSLAFILQERSVSANQVREMDALVPVQTEAPRKTEAPRATEKPEAEINPLISAKPNILNFEPANPGFSYLDLGFKNPAVGIRSLQKRGGHCVMGSTLSIREAGVEAKDSVCLLLKLSSDGYSDREINAKKISQILVKYAEMKPNTNYVLRIGRLSEKDSSKYIDYAFSSAPEPAKK